MFLHLANSSSYYSSFHQPPKCIKGGPHPDLGTTMKQKMFQNVEKTQAKEATSKEVAAKAKHAKFSIDIAHK